MGNHGRFGWGACLFWSLWALLSALAPRDLPAAEPTWKAGLAKAKITPERPFWLAGFGARTRPAEGTLQDLWLKVLALEDADGGLGVIVTADLLGFPKGMADRLSLELKKRCGLQRRQLMFTASHTHSGPVLKNALYDIYPLDDGQRKLIEEYSTALELTVLQKVEEALADRQAVSLWAGEGSARFAVNRRTNRESELAAMLEQGVAPKGPSDFSVPVLVVRAWESEPRKGKCRALVFGYAAHTSAMNLKEYGYHYCGDYAGFCQSELQKTHPGMQAMFYQGCGSDQSAAPRGTLKRCVEMGGQLAAAVQKVLQDPLQNSLRPLPPRLSTALEFVRLDFEPVTKEHLEKVALRKGYPARWARRLLREISEGASLAKAYPEYPVQVWKLGDEQLWIALGGEVTVDYALAFKKMLGARTWVNGYTNDVMAYIPSRRLWEEGGYQAGAFEVYGLPALRWCPDIEERITRSVERLVRMVK